jgi:hypothetical protein
VIFPYKILEMFFYSKLSRVDKVRMISSEINKKFKFNHLSVNKLVSIIKYYGYDISGLEFNTLFDVFSLLRSKKITKFNNSILEINSEKITGEAWLLLYEIFCFNGIYYNGLPFRDKAKTYYSNIKDHASIGVVLEDGLVTVKQNQIFQSLIKGKDSNTRDKINAYLAISSGELKYSVSNIPNFDPFFFKLINNKSIAIVGPSASNKNDANEIDSFDVVVRLNYTEQGKGCDRLHKGEKVDISYFNGEQVKSLGFNNGIFILDELKYSCFKGSRAFSNFIKIGSKASHREMTNFNNLLFHGTYNLIPLAVMDLLLYSPFKIKIFHSDLMLTKERHQGYYSYDLLDRSQSEVNSKFRLSTITHDPIAQYKLLKTLYDQNKIYGDGVFNGVMSMGEVSYSKELQEKYNL